MIGPDQYDSHAPKGTPRPASKPVLAFARTVAGRPTGYSAGANEQTWKQATRAVFEGCTLSESCRVRVEIDFLLAPDQVGRVEPDLDNLIKSTVDALEGVLGVRPGTGARMEADDDHPDEHEQRADEIYGYASRIKNKFPNTRWAIVGGHAPLLASRLHLLDWADFRIVNWRQEITGVPIPQSHAFEFLEPWKGNLWDFGVAEDVIEREKQIAEIITAATQDREKFYNGKHPNLPA